MKDRNFKLFLVFAVVLLVLLWGIAKPDGESRVIPETHSGQNFTVFINDEVVVFNDFMGRPELLKTNRTMVPIRIISENMGYEVDWNPDTDQAIIINDGKTVLIDVWTSFATVNGNKIHVDYSGEGASKKPVEDTRSYIRDSRTYVPLRFITEAFGGTVEYQNTPAGHVIKIRTAGYVPPTPNTDVTFNPATDLMADGRMTQEKTREFLDVAIDHFTVTPTSFSYDKMELPEGFRLGIGFSALAGPGEGISYTNDPILEEQRIPVNESFTRSLSSDIATKAGFILRLTIVNSAGQTASRYDINYMPNTTGRSEISMTNFQGGFDKIITFDKTRIFEGL